MNVSSLLLIGIVFYSVSAVVVQADEIDFPKLSTEEKIVAAFRIHRIKERLTETELKRFAEELDRLEATDCLIWETVKSLQQNSYGGSIPQQFKDRLENQERILQLVTQTLQDAIGKVDTESRKEIQKLALKIAGTENSKAYVEEKVLPFIKKEISQQQLEISEVKAAVRLSSLMYQQEFGSLCDRVKQHANEIEVLNKRLSRLEGGSISDGEPRTTLKPNMQQSHNDIGEWRSVNGTDWEPEGYATREELCSNPKKGPENVYFDTKVLTKSGWVAHRHFGDMWRDCSGRIVMVWKKPRLDY